MTQSESELKQNEILFMMYYAVAAVDGHVHPSEREYLSKIADRLGVDADKCIQDCAHQNFDQYQSEEETEYLATYSVDQRLQMMIDVTGLTMIDGVQHFDEILLAGKIHHLFGFPATIFAFTYINIVQYLDIGDEEPVPNHPKLVDFLDDPAQRQHIVDMIKNTTMVNALMG